MDRNYINTLFVLLTAAIARHGIARTPGAAPDKGVDAGEFMFMQTAKGYHQFKHSRSRNYVFVQGSVGPRGFVGHLLVPATDEPFLQGIFPAD
jgi:hypothetical protein